MTPAEVLTAATNVVLLTVVMLLAIVAGAVVSAFVGAVLVFEWYTGSKCRTSTKKMRGVDHE